MSGVAVPTVERHMSGLFDAATGLLVAVRDANGREQALLASWIVTPNYNLGDNTAIQQALAAVLAIGPGAVLLLEPREYIITQQVRVTKGIWIIVRPGAANGSNGAPTGMTASFKWGSDVAEAMAVWKSASASEAINRGGILGLTFDGNNIATQGLHVSSACFAEFDITTYRTTTDGVRVDDGNGVLTNGVRFTRIEHFCGSNPLSWSSNGLYIDGDVTPAYGTCVTVDWMEAEIVNGHGLTIKAADSCEVLRSKIYSRSGGFLFSVSFVAGSGYTNGTYAISATSGGSGTGAAISVTVSGGAIVAAVITAAGSGYRQTPTFDIASLGGGSGGSVTGVITSGYHYRFLKSINSSTFHCQKNRVLFGIGGGDIYFGDYTKNNIVDGVFEYGKIIHESTANQRTNHIGRLTDFRNGGSWATHQFKLNDRLSLQLSEFSGYGTPAGVTTPGSIGTGIAWAFDPAATEGVGYTGITPVDWSDGSITGVRLRLASVGATAGNVVFKVQGLARDSNGAIGGFTQTLTQTLTPHQGAPSYLTTHDFIFPTALYTYLGGFFAIAIERIGGDAADTYTNDIHLVGVQVLYAAAGPNSAGSYGPYREFVIGGGDANP